MSGFCKGRLAPWGKLCLTVLTASMALSAGRAVADEEVRFVTDGELTATYDNNVSRAERERDILRDYSLLANVDVVMRTQPSFSTALNLRAFLEGEAYQDIDTLNRGSAGGQAILRWQPTRGYSAPVYQFTLTAQLDNYDVSQRDSMVYTAQAFGSKRLNDRLMMAVGVEGVDRVSDGTVFDTKNGRLFVNLDAELTDSLAAYGGYSYLYGDTFSSAQLIFCNGVAANDIFGLIKSSSAIEKDQAFNQKFCGTWVAYRLTASTHVLTLGLNQAFGHRLSADLSVQGVQVYAEGDNNYNRVLVRAGLLARF